MHATRLWAFSFACLLFLTGCQHARKDARLAPAVSQLKKVAQVESGVVGFSWWGKWLWVSKYHGQGTLFKVDPAIGRFDPAVIPAITEIAPMGGGICFVGEDLWIADSYGKAFGSVQPFGGALLSVFRGEHVPEKPNIQNYASLAYDGMHLWMAFHMTQYDVPASQTQLLLRRDLKTGKVTKTIPAPAGTANDATHGLTWDGKNLWHGKGNRLCKVDPDNGQIKAEYNLPGIERISGLAWNESTMWVLEFSGGIWELPFARATKKSPR